jgi:5-methyltetrahydrofolate--homocysteine methyltransferase
MPKVIAAVRDASLAEPCKVMVGGAPVTQQFADSIGADGYSSHAAGAVTLARQFMAVS